MSRQRLNKNDILRSKLTDQLAKVYGNSLLGLYEDKLRIEIITEEGEVVQFSLMPIVHRDLVDESQCEPYVNTKEKVLRYNELLLKRSN